MRDITLLHFKNWSSSGTHWTQQFIVVEFWVDLRLLMTQCSGAVLTPSVLLRARHTRFAQWARRPLQHKRLRPAYQCHAQSLAATNRVTEQLNCLTVESFFMSCSISWMASLIDNLYLLDLIVLVINWQHVNLRGTIWNALEGSSRDPVPCKISDSICSFAMLICNHTEAERSVWVMGPSSGKEQQCGSHAKLS